MAQHLQALQRAAAAEESAHHLERQAMTSQEEVDRLSSQVGAACKMTSSLSSPEQPQGLSCSAYHIWGLQACLKRVACNVLSLPRLGAYDNQS